MEPQVGERSRARRCSEAVTVMVDEEERGMHNKGDADWGCCE